MIIGELFRTILWQPLFNLLILFYVYLPGQDFGLAIVCLTVLIRLILYPLHNKAVKSQLVLQKLQPKIKEIQAKYKDNKEKLTKEFLALYRGQKVNPFSGILLLFLQLPILFALYRVFWRGLNQESFVHLYSFVPRPEMIDPSFFGLVNLNQPSLILAVLAGAIQFFQIKTATLNHPKSKGKKQKSFSEVIQKQMNYLTPIIIVIFFSKLPSALALYLIISGIFTIFQQRLIKKKLKEQGL
jgi:YidC/Oxa1 family membrane protein insertase